MNYMILIAIILPIAAGIILLFLPDGALGDRKRLLSATGV